MTQKNRIDFADLKVFLSIVRWGSFKSAAKELGLTPSALSHAIRRLEDRLGAKLLNRTSSSRIAHFFGAGFSGASGRWLQQDRRRA
ncbi:LysR family transcriptional regulator [Pseudomonas gregormendelii]